MNDPSGAGRFGCCIQCGSFWDCPTRAGTRESSECCPQCSKYEICKIIDEKVKEGLKKAV